MILMVYAGHTTTADLMARLMERFAADMGVSFCAKETTQISRNDIRQADTVLIIRGADYLQAKICEAAHDAHRNCIQYIDDDLLELYEPDDPCHQALLKCIGAADIVWTSNRNMERKYGALAGADTKTVNVPAIDPWETLAAYHSDEDSVGILFAGSPSHEKAVVKYLWPALHNVHRRHPEIRVLFIGYKGTSIDGAAPYIRATGWFDDAEEYREYVIKQNMQVGLAVVEDSPFGRCKFFNKYLEYSKLGIMGIYSHCEPYTFVIKDETNGLLVGNSIEDWEQAIERAVTDPALREKCVKNAQADLMESFSTEAVIGKIVSAIPELMEYRAPEEYIHYHRTGRVEHIILRILWKVKRVGTSILKEIG